MSVKIPDSVSRSSSDSATWKPDSVRCFLFAVFFYSGISVLVYVAKAMLMHKSEGPFWVPCCYYIYVYTLICDNKTISTVSNASVLNLM